MTAMARARGRAPSPSATGERRTLAVSERPRLLEICRSVQQEHAPRRLDKRAAGRAYGSSWCTAQKASRGALPCESGE
jgi:hypothetical protein